MQILLWAVFLGYLVCLFVCIFNIAKLHKHSKRADTDRERILQSERELTARIQALEDGICPDYEQAKEAAAAVNNFNVGLTNLLGYDPLRAHEAAEEKRRRGEV